MDKTPITIACLSDAPSFADDVADRVWKAWWQPKGYSLAHVRALVQPSLTDQSLPFTLVASQGKQFVGCVGGIASDDDNHRDLSPWIAALWVDPAFRGQGHARALVDKALDLLFVNYASVYLCARPPVAPLYEKWGWALLEKDGGADPKHFFVKRRSPKNLPGPNEL